MNMDTNTDSSSASSVVSHNDAINQAVDTIETSLEHLSINEIEVFMEKLQDLQGYMSEIVISRIPGNRLSLVEGEWRIAVTTNSGDKADILTKYRSVFAASSLYALEGYATQLLSVERETVERFSLLAAKPFHEDFADYYARELACATAKMKALESLLEEIRRVTETHGGNAVAAMAGLDSTVIETLVAFNQDDVNNSDE